MGSLKGSEREWAIDPFIYRTYPPLLPSFVSVVLMPVDYDRVDIDVIG